MYFLKKGTFEFDKLTRDGYDIDEQPNVIAKKQYANGNRKKIITDYTDVVINIIINGLNADDVDTYISNLADGEFEYFSFVDMAYKTANFITTIPKIELMNGYSTDELYFDRLKVTLEKSSDV